MLQFEMPARKSDDDPLGVEAGKMLGAIALKRGLQQNQVAAYAGLPASTIHNYFTGNTKKPSLTYILKISKALGVTLDQLLGFSPMPEIVPITPDDRLGRLEATVEELRLMLLETDPRKAASGTRPVPAKSASDDRRPSTGRRRRASGGS